MREEAMSQIERDEGQGTVSTLIIKDVGRVTRVPEHTFPIPKGATAIGVSITGTIINLTFIIPGESDPDIRVSNIEKRLDYVEDALLQLESK